MVRVSAQANRVESSIAFLAMDSFSPRSPEPSLRSSTQSVQTRLTSYSWKVRLVFVDSREVASPLCFHQSSDVTDVSAGRLREAVKAHEILLARLHSSLSARKNRVHRDGVGPLGHNRSPGNREPRPGATMRAFRTSRASRVAPYSAKPQPSCCAAWGFSGTGFCGARQSCCSVTRSASSSRCRSACPVSLVSGCRPHGVPLSPPSSPANLDRTRTRAGFRTVSGVLPK